MKDETKTWLDYSKENLESSKIFIKRKLYNPCLQNIQQSVEKALKAIFIERTIKLKKTHSITELRNILKENKINIDLDEDDCDFLDSIYLPSKYPVINVLPFYEPDDEICQKGIKIAESVLNSV
ncbi:MAG: HEPN domain-containing protein [Candidatus Marinimicrobia bacterium]|nr:HEPN domain-containing protein [Candidatus Neomarinimicrobiota bacterium]